MFCVSARSILRISGAGLVLVAVACAGQRQPRGEGSAPRGNSGVANVDPVTLYRRAGLIAAPGPVSFVGFLGFFAGSHADSTLSMLTLSLPTRSLTFTRDGDRYRASYTVSADFQRGGSIAYHFDARETVRVATFRETSRAEESIIFQEYFDLLPGTYSLSVVVQDEAGTRKGEFQGEMVVPAVAARGISSSVPIYEGTPRSNRDSLPQIVPSPRSTAVFGRDSVLTAYVELYGLAPDQPVRVAVRGERDATLWSDSLRPSVTGSVASSLVRIPISPLGIGAVELVLWRPGSRDSSRTPFFVSFGDELPVATFEDMLSYLRYFASDRRLRALRDTTPEHRADAWATFLRETDPDPATRVHEGLQAYFGRIQHANQTFREEGQGWLTDRGKVHVTLGEPDQYVVDPRNANQRGQVQEWVYFRYQLRLMFVDQTGFGRWLLTQNSELAFENLVRRELNR